MLLLFKSKPWGHLASGSLFGLLNHAAIFVTARMLVGQVSLYGLKFFPGLIKKFLSEKMTKSSTFGIDNAAILSLGKNHYISAKL